VTSLMAHGRFAFARTGFAALALACLLAGPASAAGAKKDGADKAVARCRLAMGEVKDIRADASMGAIGNSVVKVADPAAWTRDGFAKTLADNQTLDIVAADTGPDETLNVELVKAYIEQVNTVKSATVVVRVTYAGRSAAGPRVYRGVRTGTNWWNTESELDGAMALALDQAARSVSADASAACRGLLH
jgi:hypothetical protein